MKMIELGSVPRSCMDSEDLDNCGILVLINDLF